MELFTIQCTTCRARLKVKDESIIGDILACPKCNSMVQVVPPVDWKRSIAADQSGAVTLHGLPAAKSAAARVVIAKPADSQPAAKRAAAIVPPVLPVVPSTKVNLTKAEAGKGTFASQPAQTLAASAPAADIPTIQQPPIASPTVMPLVHSRTVFATARGVTSAMQHYLGRDWALYGGGLVVGGAVGVCAWLLLLPGPAPVSNVADAMGRAEVPLAAAPSSTPETRPAAKSQPAAVVAQKPIANDVQPNVDTEPATPAAPATEASSELPAEQPASDDPQPAAPADIAPGVPASSIKLEPLPPSKTSPEPADSASPSVPATAASDDDALGEASTDGSTSGDRDAKLSDPKSGDGNAVSGDSNAVSGDSDTRSGGRPTLTRAEIDERLAVAIPSIRTSKVPLSQFVSFLADFSNLPIAIDDAVLAKTGQGSQTPVSVHLSDTTARDALQAALKSLHLKCEVRGGTLVITSRTAAKEGAAAKEASAK